MKASLIILLGLAIALHSSIGPQTPLAEGNSDGPNLLVGFGEKDITPKLGEKPVYMAGFGHNRIATGVHDPLMARALVLKHAHRNIALVSIDLVGYFHEYVTQVRRKLPGFTYVLVSSTHNHEGPDTLGLWGPNPFAPGIDPSYLKYVEGQIVAAVREADEKARPARAQIGTARAPELLHDGREPYIKHDELVALQFTEPQTNRASGIVVQWNCHPETLADKNTEISSDFVGPTVEYLRKRNNCPVVYFTGTVGGLMTSLHVEVKDSSGKPLADGTKEKTERYGKLVGQLAEKALSGAKPVQLTPLSARSREVFVHLQNKAFQVGQQVGVLKREAFLWQGDPYKAEPAGGGVIGKATCCKTEVGWLRLGDLDVALIPGEIYPELVLDKVQDPPDPAADFPDAPIEPAIYKQLSGPHRMLIGLANDEIGYIIPKRQWDEKPPFCYGRNKSQYGEINSIGPDAAATIAHAFQALARIHD